MDILIELLKLYGWQALVVALCVFAIIELIKPHIRKIVVKDSVRHTIYTLLNYILTLGLAALLTFVVTGNIDGLMHLYGTAIVVVNILYPIIANVGFFDWISKVFKEVFKKVIEEGAWKKIVLDLANKFGLDLEVIEMIIIKIEKEYLPTICNCEGGAEAFFDKFKAELILNIRQKLAGFVENGKLQEVAEALFDKLKDGFIGNKEGVDK